MNRGILVANKDDDYFKMFVISAEYTCTASKSLLDLVINYTDIENKVNEIHRIEHEADIHYHKIFERLNKSFITPIEREDILLLANNLDNITDSIEDIAYRFLMFGIQNMRDEAIKFVEIIIRSCNELKTALTEFNKFKKSNVIAQKILEVNNCEEEGDKLYHSTVRKLFATCKDPIEIMKWREIFEKMENCLDSCEDAANALEGIIMKNT